MNRRPVLDAIVGECSNQLRQQSRSKYQPKSNASKRHRLDLFSAVIWIFLFVVVCVEFFAFNALNDGASPSFVDTANVSDATNGGVVNGNEPTRRPTTKTFEPTPQARGWRVKAARLSQNSFFWKTHVPDPVPPLPPDIDPETGQTLPPVVAYIVTLTKCSTRHSRSLDGAAVLLHSIRRNSYGWVPMNTQMNQISSSHFDTSMWPLYGGQGGRGIPEIPSSQGDCARYLQRLGYIILHRPPLVPLFEITSEFFNMSGGNEFFNDYKSLGYLGQERSLSGPLARADGEREDKLRLAVYNDGCCGYAETLKLHLYGFVEHKLAVHLDLDSLILRPMDDLFDVMLGKAASDGNRNITVPIAKGAKTKKPDFTRSIDAAFTRDYNQVTSPSPDAAVGYQGGFLVVRPSLEVLERFRDILRRGEFILTQNKMKRGWGGKYGPFYGAMTFQGLLPYYYEDVAPKDEHNEIELDRCVYNQMADNPRKSTYKFPRATPLDPKVMGFRDTKVCRDGRTDCSDTDCQRVHPKDTVTTHFTFAKPWDCSDGLPGTVADDTCKGLLREWFAVRRELEDFWIMSSSNDKEPSYWESETLSAVQEHRDGLSGHYLGYCKASEDSKAYLKLGAFDHCTLENESFDGVHHTQSCDCRHSDSCYHYFHANWDDHGSYCILHLNFQTGGVVVPCLSSHHYQDDAH
ncbi:LOW QUALITY PROTEIN: hypothetical protein HJC23_002654 [Cyclotella cryptica]|uniref:Uncharacterized protein n=1 Tax=Cyclotella cryptica TaxID=29204 RepID=A0ABD3PLJ3_9STRA